jgi:hypothetical protein
VVGYAGGHDQIDGFVAGSPPDTRAVLWHDGVALDLNQLTGGGWDLEVAHDVNNNGRIVGSGIKPGDTVPHGFMLVPLTKVSALTAPASVAGGRESRMTVTLNRPAPPDDATVFLASSNSIVGVPATITIPRGQSSATFTVATTAVKRTVSVTLTARFDGSSSTARLTVTAHV